MNQTDQPAIQAQITLGDTEYKLDSSDANSLSQLSPEHRRQLVLLAQAVVQHSKRQRTATAPSTGEKIPAQPATELATQRTQASGPQTDFSAKGQAAERANPNTDTAAKSVTTSATTSSKTTNKIASASAEASASAQGTTDVDALMQTLAMAEKPRSLPSKNSFYKWIAIIALVIIGLIALF